MGKDKHKAKNILTKDELITYLETLVNGLKQGSIIMDNEERPLLLRPSESIEAEIEIKQKIDKEKLELKLSWVPNRQQPFTAPIVLDETSSTLGFEAKKK